MEMTLFITIIGTGIGIVSLIYAIMRNFKTDINSHIDRMESKFEKIDSNFQKMDQRVTITNNRMDGVYHILLKKLEKTGV